jgi:PAS domain S-box-containing protein
MVTVTGSDRRSVADARPSDSNGGRRAVADGGRSDPIVGHETLLETMRDGVLVVRADGEVAYCNAAAERLLGIDRSTYVGGPLSALGRDGVLADPDLSSLRRAAEGADAPTTLELHVGAGGAATAVECRIARLPSEAPDGALATIRDLTERRQTERELRERHDTIERLHESTARLVASRDESELFELAIEAASTVLDLEACAVVVDEEDGLVVADATGGDNAPEPGHRVADTDGIAHRTAAAGESVLVQDVRTDDRAAPYDDSYRSALSVPIGEYGAFQAIAEDVGAYDHTDLRLAELLARHVAETLERIRAERRLHEREADLREERDRFAALFDNIPDAVAAFRFEDGEPIVRDVNDAFEETFGWSEADIVGENIDEYIVPPDRTERADSLNETLLAGEQLQTTGRRRTADGVRDFLLHVVPLSVGERTLEGYAIYTDITEQKRRERELERQNERLDEFASIVSHDLRNPLNVAQGNLKMARERDEERFFDLVAEAQDRMSRMIDELLSLARHGDVVGEQRPVVFGDVARRAWEAVATGDAELAVADEFVVVADRERLTELLENLFRNAVEHGSTSPDSQARRNSVEHGSTSGRTQSDDTAGTRSGEPSTARAPDDPVEHADTGDDDDVTVTVGALDPDVDHATFDGEVDVDGFYVADDGPGIPVEDRETVFESGYTTADNGTGFGLTIVEQIAEAHDWSVAVAESDAGGARFEFRV